MARTARIVIPGEPHHITQRGNNKQAVFSTNLDRTAYLRFLKEESTRHGLHIVGYCLMTNHVHIVAIPETADSLQKAIGRTHFRYTQVFNRLHNHSGHLWQNRFFSCAMDEAHFLYTLRYMEQNPVRAGMETQPWDYPWSSATAHIGGNDLSGLLDLGWWKNIQDPVEWKDLLVEGLPETITAALTRNTQTGRPLGSDSFIAKVEALLNRRVRPLPGGRPRKDKTR